MTASVQAKFRKARVARMATVDRDGRPHVVPVCFAYDGHAFYTALDLKPKRVSPQTLARVRHIRANPNVALLLDDYREDWGRLWYIMVRGTARLLHNDEQEQRRAHGLLKDKYPQYAAGLLPDEAPIIQIVPSRIIPWGKL